jgi:uncharacterized protein (TIRG00374 family)
VIPLREHHRDDEGVHVRNKSDDERPREPDPASSRPEDERHGDEQGQSEGAARPCVVARVAPEFPDIHRMPADLHPDEGDQQQGVRADDFGMTDPERDADRRVEDRVGNAVEAAQVRGRDTEVARDLAVVNVGEPGDDHRHGNIAYVSVPPSDEEDDRREDDAQDGERERGKTSQSLIGRGRMRVAILVALVMIAWINRDSVDWRATLMLLRKASWPVVALTAIATFSSTLIKGVRWWLFLRRSTTLGLGHVIRLTVASTSLNSVLVANAGDVTRVALAAREGGVSVRVVLETLVSDKITDVLAFVTIALMALYVNPAVLSGSATTMVSSIVVGAVLIAFALRLGGRADVDDISERGWRGRLRRGTSFVARFSSDTIRRLNGRDLVWAYAFSMLAWTGQVATYALGALAIGVRLPATGGIAAVVAVNVAGVLRTTPGNIGVFQVMYALALAPYGVSVASAVAAATLIQGVQMLTSAVAGLSVMGRVARDARRTR